MGTCIPHEHTNIHTALFKHIYTYAWMYTHVLTHTHMLAYPSPVCFRVSPDTSAVDGAN